jgi:hypothetical protein
VANAGGGEKMHTVGYRDAINSKEELDKLLEQAAAERDRGKFLELLREINRVRAARWLASGLRMPGAPPSNMETDSFDLFAGAPDRDAAWLETVVGLEAAKERVNELAAENPGEYFVFHSRSHTVLVHLITGHNPVPSPNRERHVA